VAVLVAPPVPPVSVPLPVAMFDAVPVPVADPVPVAVLDAVPVPVAEPASSAVPGALPVVVVKAVPVPELGMLASLAASAAGKPSAGPASAAFGAASEARGLLLPQHGTSTKMRAKTTHGLARCRFHMGLLSFALTANK
jgi:hypothetical protein